MNQHRLNIILGFVNKLPDEGMRKAMLLRLRYGYSDKQIAQALEISEKLAEKLGRRGALAVQELIYKEMQRKKIIVGGLS